METSKSVKALTVLLLLISASFAAFPVPKVSQPYCRPAEETKDPKLACLCLHYHPDPEFCKDETAPIPSCCKAGEKNSGVKGCLCCAGAKAALTSEHGTYIHNQPAEVEYSLK